MLQAEVQLRKPFDQLSLVAWALRRDGSVKFRSQPWCDYTGIFCRIFKHLRRAGSGAF
jgi:hypothetical protein